MLGIANKAWKKGTRDEYITIKPKVSDLEWR